MIIYEIAPGHFTAWQPTQWARVAKLAKLDAKLPSRLGLAVQTKTLRALIKNDYLTADEHDRLDLQSLRDHLAAVSAERGTYWNQRKASWII